MAGSDTDYYCNLATGLSASASRLKTNINSVIEKYNRHFKDDDVISLASLSISKYSSRGTLKRIRNSHKFGTSKLKATKKKDELLKSKLGFRNKVDLNVSKAIQRECAVALADIIPVTEDEPSDAETLSSVDDDEDEFESNNDEGEEISRDGDDEEEERDDSKSSIIDDKSSNSEVQSDEDSYFEDEVSKSVESSLDSLSSHNDVSTMKRNDEKVVKQLGITIDLTRDSDDDDDDGTDEVDGTITLCSNGKNNICSGSPTRSNLNHTYILPSPSRRTQVTREKRSEFGAVIFRKHGKLDDCDIVDSVNSCTDSSFVSISSRPRRGVKGETQIKTVRNSPHDNVKVPKNQTMFSKSPIVSTCKTYIANKGTPVLNTPIAKSDGVFKSPQGITVRRVAPIPVGHASASTLASNSPKHSSQSSGISSGSSPSTSREMSLKHDGGHGFNANSKFLNIHSNANLYQYISARQDIRQPEAQRNWNRPNENFDENIMNCVKTKGSRVNQWVDMVNLNSSVSKEPLRYPSCPPKLPARFNQQSAQTQSCSFQQLSTPQPLSPDKQRDIGIQTTLNCTGRVVKMNLPSKKMKDVSTIFSYSFLDAHSPSRHSKITSRILHDDVADDSAEENIAANDDRNIMFPEEYVYRFSPLNPNRMDSDNSANLHQNQCLREGLRCFRPKRNAKRLLESDIQDDTLHSSRVSKYRRLENAFKSRPVNDRSCDASYAILNSHESENDTYVVRDSRITPNLNVHRESCPTDSVSMRKPCYHLEEEEEDLYSSNFTPDAEIISSHLSGRGHLRSNTPLCKVGCRNDEHGSCDFVNSSVSEINKSKDYFDKNESWVSPKLGVFLNSTGSHDQSNFSFSTCQSEDKSRKSIVKQKEFNDTFTSHRTEPKTPDSFLSPVKRINISNSITPKEARKMPNSLQFVSSNDNVLVNKDMSNSFMIKNLYPSPSRISGHVKDQSDKISHSKASSKQGNYSVLSLSEYLVDEEDVEDSGSFVDAHTPKPKFLSPLKVLASDSKNKNENKCDTHCFTPKVCHKFTAVIENNPIARTTPDWRMKRTLGKETLFESAYTVPNSNSTFNEKYSYSIDSRGVSGDSRRGCKKYSQNASILESTGINVDASEDFNSLDAGKNNENSRKHQRYSSQSLRHERKDQRGQNSSVLAGRMAHIGQASRSRYHRASTPVECNRTFTSVRLNDSMSTIVGPQDKDDYDDNENSDDDWGSKLMEDVDIL